MAMDHVFDSANTMFGPSSALVFVDETGAEVRPLSRLHISNVNFSLYGCVLRSQAVIVRNGEGGWRYRDRPEAF